MNLIKTTRGKLTLLLIFYIPFLCALFFHLFDGRMYESPIGGCCIPMEGVVAVGYILFTIWVFAPLVILYAAYVCYKKLKKEK